MAATPYPAYRTSSTVATYRTHRRMALTLIRPTNTGIYYVGHSPIAMRAIPSSVSRLAPSRAWIDIPCWMLV